MRLLLTLLVAFLAVPAASAQAPGAIPPDADAEVPFGASAETSGTASRGGDALERLGVWGEGPSYAVDADAEGRVVWGSGRHVRAAVPGQADTLDVMLPGNVREIVLAWPLAYVGTHHAGDREARGLEIVDLVAEEVVGRLAGPYVYGIHVDEGVALINAFDGGWRLQSVDVSDPSAPSVLEEVPLSGFLRGLDVEGGYAFVGGGAAGIHVVDVFARGQLSFVQTIKVSSYVRYLDIQGGRLAAATGSYADGSGSVQFYSLVDNPIFPAFQTEWTFASPVEDVVWSGGDEVVVAASQSGVALVNVDGGITGLAYTAPANLVPGANRVAVLPSGEVVAADYYYGGFRTRPETEAYERAWTGGSFAFDLITDADDPQTVYVASGSYGVARLRAEADGDLVQTGRAHDGFWNYTRDVAQDAERLYVADGFSGFHVVDKATMERLETYDLFFVDRIAVDPVGGAILATGEGRAIVARWSAEGLVIDGVIEGLDTGSAEAYDGYGYVGATTGTDVTVIRLSPSPAPEVVGAFGTAGERVGLALDANVGRLAAYGGSTQIDLLDLDTPVTPEPLGSVLLPTGGATFAFGGSRLAVAVTGQTQLVVYDAYSFGAAEAVGAQNGFYTAPYAIALTEADVFVSVGPGGVERLRNGLAVASESGPPGADAAFTLAPNPTAGAARITVAREGEVRAEVWTATGRRVRVLASGERMAAGATLEWDGRDETGARAAAGVYLVRVTVDGAMRTLPLVVAR